ncbi:MAG: hypothetical protein NPIRA06_10490 [Nitrospirales bacterium]|nr:MAG: hypothetical protein NPIRA06_10490 [Nitrospirales bacterium]
MLCSLIESKFTLFELQVKHAFVDSPETDKTSFRLPSKALKSVHMRSANKIFTISDPYQPMVPSPSVRTGHAVQGGIPSNNRLQDGFPAVREKFHPDLPLPFEDPKDRNFTIHLSFLFSFETSVLSLGVMDFYLYAQRRMRFQQLRNTFSNNPHISIRRNAIQFGQVGEL